METILIVAAIILILHGCFRSFVEGFNTAPDEGVAGSGCLEAIAGIVLLFLIWIF